MAKIVEGKITIHKCEIIVENVIGYMQKQGHAVTAVQMRDKFDWKLRQTARILTRLLKDEGKVEIHDHPTRKRSYCYTLVGQPKPTKKNFKVYKPPKNDKELRKGKFANNHKSPETSAKTEKTEKAEKPKQK